MGFLEEYQKWATDCCDAPPIFHGFCGLGALASVMARRIRFPFGAGYVYPNVWILLVGSSGSRKSQSMKLMRGLLQNAKSPIFPNEFSQEKLMSLIAERKHGTFCISEFSQFMGNIRKGYNEGTLGFLTDIYDVPEEYTRTTQKSEHTLIRPTVVLFACSTPDYMGANEDEWASGFGPRFLVINGERTDHLPLPPPPNPDRAKRLERFLHNAGRIAAVCSLEDEEHYKKWASAFDASMRSKSLMEQSIGVRVENYVLKISMLVQISMMEELFHGVPTHLTVDGLARDEKPHKLLITKAAVEKSIEIAERVMARQYESVRNSSVGSGGSDNKKRIKSFAEAMRTLGGGEGAAVLHAALMKHTGWSAPDLTGVVRDMEQSGDLLTVKVPGAAGRNARGYQLTATGRSM